MIGMTEDDRRDWIGVDLDGTLAHWTRWTEPTVIGMPIPTMVERVQLWLQQGERVKILTARAHSPDALVAIHDWVEMHILGPMRDTGIRHGMFVPTPRWQSNCKVPDSLEVVTSKDHLMRVLYDDRAVQVERNTGMLKVEVLERHLEKLKELSKGMAHAVRKDLTGLENWLQEIEEVLK